MKKWMALLAALSVLAACNQATESEQSNTGTSIVKEARAEETKPDAGLQLKTETDRFSYAIGAMQGKRMSDDIDNMQEIKLDKKLLGKGFIDGMQGKSSMTDKETQDLLMEYQKKIRAAMTEKQNKQAEAAKATGEAFLKENGKKEGITTTASGLQYEILSKGDGKNRPKKSDTVKVHYVGTLLDGTTFDSSIKRGEPTQFGLSQVIPGWTEGLQLMSKGGKFRFYIPSKLAYGERALPSIPANSVLTFEVELLEINPAQ